MNPIHKPLIIDGRAHVCADSHRLIPMDASAVRWITIYMPDLPMIHALDGTLRLVTCADERVPMEVTRITWEAARRYLMGPMPGGAW